MTEILEQPKQNIIYFNSDHSKTPECSGQLAAFMELSWTLVSTWGEMADALRNRNDALLAVHVDMMTHGPVKSVTEFMDALATITKFKPCGDRLLVAVLINADTPRIVIKDLQRTQCQGILLHIDEYTNHEVNQAMKALGSGIPYWPKHILENLPGSKKKIISAGNITLTERQSQVFSHITERGSSNKMIAKSLGISESTVKLHVGEIFKKYGVRTRTQLAVFSSA